MKLLFLPLLFIISINTCFAYETKGLYRLNPFPTKNWVSRTYLRYEVVDVNLSRALNGARKFSEYHHFLEEEIGKRVFDSSFFSVSASYASAGIARLKDNEFSTQKSNISGFSEPTFKFYSRSNWAKYEGDSVFDFMISYTPSLAKRKVGSSAGNNAVGGDILQLEINRGTFYTNWDFNLKFNYTLHGKKKEEDLAIDKDRAIQAVGQYLAMFEFQHVLLPFSYFIRGGIGLQAIEDTESNVGDTTTITQQGTGSNLYIGFVNTGEHWTWLFKVSRQKNDYFIKNDSMNLDGDYVVKTMSFELLREF